jgi:hypothetical protein
VLFDPFAQSILEFAVPRPGSQTIAIDKTIQLEESARRLKLQASRLANILSRWLGSQIPPEIGTAEVKGVKRRALSTSSGTAVPGGVGFEGASRGDCCGKL